MRKCQKKEGKNFPSFFTTSSCPSPQGCTRRGTPQRNCHSRNSYSRPHHRGSVARRVGTHRTCIPYLLTPQNFIDCENLSSALSLKDNIPSFETFLEVDFHILIVGLELCQYFSYFFNCHSSSSSSQGAGQLGSALQLGNFSPSSAQQKLHSEHFIVTPPHHGHRPP